MAKKLCLERKKANRVCFDCIHFYACSAWNVGDLRSTNASYCVNYETLQDLWRKYSFMIGESEETTNRE